jgi:hypothetical protein
VTRKPAALASFTAVWRSDDAAGAVKIISPSRDVTGASIASDLISVDPKLCKGNFGAARSSEVVDGAVVFRAALSCVEGEDDRTAQYFVAPRQRGGFLIFAVIGNSAAGESAPNRLKPDLLGRAALRQRSRAAEPACPPARSHGTRMTFDEVERPPRCNARHGSPRRDRSCPAARARSNARSAAAKPGFARPKQARCCAVVTVPVPMTH